MSEQDAQLVGRCLAGDQSAYESLYGQHARRIKAYLARSGFKGADADDLTQETFVRAFGSLAGYDASLGSFGGWLSAIARNVARRHFNRRGDARNFDPELAEQTLAVESNPGHAAEADEEADAINDCISRLPEPLAGIVRLRYVEARTTRGIAAASGMPESTVRLRLGEAMAEIERCLKSKGILE